MNKKVLIAIIVALVLVVGSFAVLSLNSKDGNETNSSANQTSSSNEASDMDMSQHENQSSANDNDGAVATNTVEIANNDYSPAKITVKKGTTVTWTNEDSVQHTVTAKDGQKGPDSGMLSKGQSFSYTYDEVGTFEYFCVPHPFMVGTVTVTE